MKASIPAPNGPVPTISDGSSRTTLRPVKPTESTHDEGHVQRRGFLTAAAVFGAGLAAAPVQAFAEVSRPQFRYCLNTSTIQHSQVPLRRQLQIAADAGYDSVEIWLPDVDRFVAEGGSLDDARSEIMDLGLGVDSAIAFGKWIVDDPAERKAGLEQCKRDMDKLRRLGGRHLAAPPSGATREAGLDLDRAGERYRALLELGRECDVLPQLELWGFSKNLSTLPELLYVAAAAEHPDACLLLDVYHLYKGGSDFSNLPLVAGQRLHCLHMNDYPADPPRDSIADRDRVYPGDGVAPLSRILPTLAAGGFSGTLSLELFNPEYWKKPPAEVARIGLAKMKSVVAKAFPTS